MITHLTGSVPNKQPVYRTGVSDGSVQGTCMSSFRKSEPANSASLVNMHISTLINDF